MPSVKIPDRNKIFVHRANYIEGSVDAFEHLANLIRAGWYQLEVDFTMTGPDSFEFCHPSQLGMSVPWNVGPDLIKKLLALGTKVTLMVDIKYQDTGVLPQQLVKDIIRAFGKRVIFVAAEPALLNECHRLGARTAQFFRPWFTSDLAFESDYVVREHPATLQDSLERTVVYCPSVSRAYNYLQLGVALVMVDGEELLEP